MSDPNSSQGDVVPDPTYPSQENPPESLASSAIPDQIIPPLPIKKSHRRLWIILGSIGGLLLVTGGITVYLVMTRLYPAVSPASPAQNPTAKTLDLYCKAMQSGDYQTASNQIEVPSIQGLNAQSLTNIYSADPVSSCTVASFGPTKSTSGKDIPDTLTVRFTITHVSKNQETDLLIMGKENNGDWKIALILLLPNDCSTILSLTLKGMDVDLTFGGACPHPSQS